MLKFLVLKLQVMRFVNSRSHHPHLLLPQLPPPPLLLPQLLLPLQHQLRHPLLHQPQPQLPRRKPERSLFKNSHSIPMKTRPMAYSILRATWTNLPSKQPKEKARKHSRILKPTPITSTKLFPAGGLFMAYHAITTKIIARWANSSP